MEVGFFEGGRCNGLVHFFPILRFFKGTTTLGGGSNFLRVEVFFCLVCALHVARVLDDWPVGSSCGSRGGVLCYVVLHVLQCAQVRGRQQ